MVQDLRDPHDWPDLRCYLAGHLIYTDPGKFTDKENRSLTLHRHGRAHSTLGCPVCAARPSECECAGCSMQHEAPTCGQCDDVVGEDNASGGTIGVYRYGAYRIEPLCKRCARADDARNASESWIHHGEEGMDE